MKTQMLVNGTVIDHLPEGMGFHCLDILKKHLQGNETLIVFMNVPSNKLEKKDMIKIQDFYLDDATSTYLSLLAPQISINIIKDSKVVKKINPEIPTEIVGTVNCVNSRCITNTEGYIPEYEIQSKVPVILKCKYCEFEFTPA
jgi:aspartate carbamoyltransferase regulatory subunit